MSDDVSRVAVYGLGNVLMGDDALGPAVLAHLEAGWTPAADVEFLDLGTPGLDLHPHLAGREAVIFVDVVRDEGAPGEVRRYDREAVLRHAPPARVSPHDPGVKEALLSLEFAGDGPRDVVLVGVVPSGLELHGGMSDEVRAAVPAAVAAVLDELERLGAPATARDDAAEPDLWWES